MSKRKAFIAVLFLLAVCVAICADFFCRNTHPRNEPPVYDSGYNDGLSIGREIGYDEGYADGYNTISLSRSDAENYACENSPYHPEDAVRIIDAFESNEPFWNDGKIPSQQDYIDAVHSLYYFYEYYFNGEFCNYCTP